MLKSRNNKNKLYKLNIVILALAALLSAVGIALLYSAAKGSFEPWAIKQFYTMIFMTFICICIAFIEPHILMRYAYPSYFVCILLLIIAEFIGHTAMGAQRWIRLGPINIQPSEFTKIALILSLARYFHLLKYEDLKLQFLIPPILLVLIPAFLILKQPNLGTSTILMTISAAIFFTAGVKLWKFGVVITSVLAAAPIIWNFFLHSYQKQRVLTFLEPEADPLGVGYNIIQSKIAIGSGGLWGKGFVAGSQNQLSFLPEKETDFIFTLLAEEFGLIGVSVVLILYMLLCFYCYYIAMQSHNQFGRLIGVGVATMFFIHVFINVSMIAGLLPVVGTPLPFLSFGRSNLIASYLGIALVLNMHINKYLSKV